MHGQIKRKTLVKQILIFKHAKRKIKTEIWQLILVRFHSLGFVSFRSVNDGTWYVNALVDTFSNYHTREDVMSMIVRVNGLVTTAYTGQGFTQCPVPIVTLTKKIYLCPLKGLK